MLALLLAGCGEDGFLDTPDNAWGLSRWRPVLPVPNDTSPSFLLRAPSLTSCVVELDDPTGFQVGSGLDRRMTYDDRGRLVSAQWRQLTPNPSQADYLWSGDCLQREDLLDDGQMLQIDYACDPWDHWESVTTAEVTPLDVLVSSEETWTNTLDLLHDVVHVDRVAVQGARLGLVDTADLLWDNQGRLAELSWVDPIAPVDIKRAYYWDHLRLLGFEDRGVGQDQHMERFFERDRLVEEVLFEEDEELQRVTYEYDGDGAWPTSRSVDGGAGFYTQDMTVTCAR